MPKGLKIFLLFPVLLILAGAAPGGKPDSSPRALRSLAVVDSLLLQNQVADAVKAARTFQEEFKDDFRWSIEFENRLAVALLRDGNPAEALPLLEAQVIAHPGEALYHRNLGACLLALGRRGRALSEYQQVVDLEPRNATARLEYGQILLDFRILKDAEKEILTAARLCGDCPEVQPVLARYYEAVRQPAKAAPCWLAVWQESENPVAKQNYLIALLASDQNQEVLKFLSPELVKNLSMTELSQIITAEQRLQISGESLRLVQFLTDGENPVKLSGDPFAVSTFWAVASNNLLVTGHYTEALVAVEQAIILSPSSVVYLNNRVVLLQKLERFEEADQRWQEVLLLDPSLEGKQN